MVHPNPRHQFAVKKEGSNRSLPPSLENLLMKRYGIYDITAKSVVMKARKVLKMAKDEAWTEDLESWCHAFLSTQLVDPAFLAAQRLRQMSSAVPPAFLAGQRNRQMSSAVPPAFLAGQRNRQMSSAVPAVAASTVARKGKSNPKSQKSFWKKTSRPSADDMLDYKRENSQKNLIQQEPSPSSAETLPKKPIRMQPNPKSQQSDAQLVPSSMESLPKKPVRKQSNPKSWLNEPSRNSQRSSLSPSDALVMESRRASLRLRESPPSEDESLISSRSKQSNPRLGKTTNERPRTGPSDTLLDRVSISRGCTSPAPLRSRTILCRPDDSVERPWKDMSLNKQASQKSLQSVSMPQRKKSPAKGILKRSTESEMDMNSLRFPNLAETVEVCRPEHSTERPWKDMSLNKQASQKSLHNIPMPQRKKSPAKGILRNKKTTESQEETELAAYQPKDIAARRWKDMSLNKQASQKSLQNIPMPQRKKSPAKGILRNKKTTESQEETELAAYQPKDIAARRWKDMSLNKQASQKSLQNIPMPQRKKSPAKGILRNKKTTEGELNTDGSVRVKNSSKAVPGEEDRNKKTTEGELNTDGSVRVTNSSKAVPGEEDIAPIHASRERPIRSLTTSDGNLSYASSLTYPSFMLLNEDLSMDRWSEHSAPPRLETPTRQRKKQTKAPERPKATRRRWTPNRMRKRIDHTPKRPQRIQVGSYSTMDSDLSDDIPMEVRVYPIEQALDEALDDIMVATKE
jgi:hypothetical protein